VYNDGSLKNSLCQWWSVGGIGVWWPERKLNDTPLNHNERNLVVRVSEKGVMLAAGPQGELDKSGVKSRSRGHVC